MLIYEERIYKDYVKDILNKKMYDEDKMLLYAVRYNEYAI